MEICCRFYSAEDSPYPAWGRFFIGAVAGGRGEKYENAENSCVLLWAKRNLYRGGEARHRAASLAWHDGGEEENEKSIILA